MKRQDDAFAGFVGRSQRLRSLFQGTLHYSAVSERVNDARKYLAKGQLVYIYFYLHSTADLLIC